jgi:hypothetical protein
MRPSRHASARIRVFGWPCWRRGGPDDAPEISMPVAFPQLFNTKYDLASYTRPKTSKAFGSCASNH